MDSDPYTPTPCCWRGGGRGRRPQLGLLHHNHLCAALSSFAAVNITALAALDVLTGNTIATLANPQALFNTSAGDNIAVWPLPNGVDSAVFLTSITPGNQAQITAYVLDYNGGE